MSETPDPLAKSSEEMLDRLLDTMPTPHMPGDLAARIVRDVTRLPQIAAEDGEAASPPEPAPVANRGVVIPLTRARPRRHWIAWTGGGAVTALAAALAALMLLPGTVQREAPPSSSSTADAISAPIVAQAKSVATSPVPAETVAAPRLAESAPLPATPRHMSVAPVTATPHAPAPQSGVEVAETGGSEATQTAAQTTPTDSIDADDAAELVDGGSGTVPDVTGQAPPPPAWGYAPGTGASRTMPRRTEEGMDDMGSGMGAPVGSGRHRGPSSPGRGF